MPRPPRLLLPQSYYHVMTRGNNRHVVFRTEGDYLYYLHLVRKYKIDHPFDLYHYCLMPNHTHFLVKTNKASDFSNFMKRLNLAYFHHYRSGYGWVGHFWQDRFKSQPVGKDSYFIQCGKYIELNPVRSGLVAQPENHSFSSFQYYFNGKLDSLVTRDFFYDEMGKTEKEKQKAYRDLVIDSSIVANYLRPVWGSRYQQHQESKKVRYHLG